jgi:tape measure domain-containing protein
MAKLYFKVGSDWEEVVRLRNEIAKLKQELMSMDGTQSPAAFKALNAQLAASNQRLDELVTNAAKAGAEMDTGFKRKIFDASQVVNGFTEKILAQKAVVKDIEADVKRLGDAYRIALKRNSLSANGKLEEYNAARKALDEEKAALFGLTQQQAEARLSVKKLRDEYTLYKNDGRQVVETNEGIAISWKKALAVIGGAGVLKALGSEMIRVRGEFQSMQTAIETMVGKDMAGQLIPQIKELAKISPLTMSDMVGAEKMMLGFNIQAEDTIKYLKAISDISMGESSKFNSLTLAFSQMSAAGKLMGQDLNQMINAGFNPLQIISEKTGKSIATLKDEMSKGAVSAEMVQQAFIDATSAGGKFYNMSENASKTINGQLSMMQDALDSVFNELGTKSESVIMDGIQMTTSLIRNYETVGKVLAGLVVTYGTYRTAVMLVTAAENGHSAATMVMRGRILLAQKAQALLNATMLKNPYVLLATVAIGAASAIWALSKRTTEAQEVQERYNASKENTIRKEEAHRQEIQRLISVASDEVEATANRNSAIEALKKAYPGIIEKYIDEEGHLTNLIQLQKELNEEQSKKKAESNQARLDAINAKVRNQEEYVLRISGSEEAIKEANDVLKELQRQQKEAQAAVNSDYINARIEEAKKLSDIELKKSISQWKSSLSKVTGDIIGDFSRDEVSSFIKSLESILYAREKQTKNKKYWEKQKKEAETALNSIASSQKKLLDTGKFKGIDDAVVNNYKDNVRKLKEAEKELKVYDSSSKQENQSPKEVTKQLKQQEQLLSIRRKNQQDEINLMEDGTERKLKQIDLDYQRELDAIRKQEQEWSKANGGKLTKEQSVQISLSYSQAENKRDKSISDLNKEKFESDKKAWQEYFIEFGNYQEKRKNLVQKYDDEIAKLHTDSPEYAIKVAEKNQAVEQLDEQFGHSAKAMADLFEDAGNKSVSAIQTIIDKYETLVKYMSGTKESDGTNVTLDELKALGFTDKDIEKIEKGEISIKDVTDAIRGLKDELKGKSPWQAFVSDLEKGIEAIKKGGNDSKKVGQGITDIGNAVTSFAPALGEFGTNIANIFGASDSAITGITDALGGLGTTAAGVGQIMSGDIVGGAMSAVSGISSVVSALDGLFGADYSHYNEMVEQYSLLNDIWDELIDKKLEYINTSYGAEANKVGEEALELAEKSIESYRILGKERLNAGSSAGSHSIGVRIRKGMSEQGWEEARKALNDEQWFKEISTGRMESLFDLSTEQLERLKSEAPTFWAKLDEDVRNYLDKIIDGEERIEEIHNQINEQLTQTTFDGVYSNFIDTLMDMKASSKDAAEDISEYFMRAMLSEQIGTLYQDKLKKWYEKFAKGMEDGSLTESERNALNAEYMGYIEEAMKLRDELAAATGYDKISQESYSQSSSSRGFGTEMTHEDAGELSGRFTALQIAGEEIKFQSIIQSQSLNLLTVKADALLSINTETRNIADDTRDLIAQSYLELVQISENTGAIVKPIIQIQKDIAEVKKNTSKL